MRLTTKLILNIIVSLGVVIFPLSLLQMYQARDASYEQAYNEHLRILNSFKAPMAEALWGMDRTYVKQLVTSMALPESTLRVEVYDENQKVFAAAGKSGDNVHEDYENHLLSAAQIAQLQAPDAKPLHFDLTDDVSVLAMPVVFRARPESPHVVSGAMAVEYSRATENKIVLYQSLQKLFLILIFMLVVSGILFFTLRRSVFSPLFKLVRAMRKIPHDRSVRLPLDPSNTIEFTQMFKTFNQVVEELAEKEKLINEQRKQMVQSSKMSALGEMASGIAHEINNPLAIIVGYNHIVQNLVGQDHPKSAEIHKTLAKLQNTTDRISKIIRGLGSFSRDSNADPRKWSPVDTIVEQTLEFCSQRFKNRGIDLKVEPVPSVEIFCRETQITQVLLNLLNNAFDAIQGQGGTRWIRVGFSYVNELFVIHVTDSGPGISKENLEKVMQPFFTTKPLGKGTGLGLSISKGIMDKHGGALRLNLANPETQFTMEFPTSMVRPTPGLTADSDIKEREY